MVIAEGARREDIVEGREVVFGKRGARGPRPAPAAPPRESQAYLEMAAAARAAFRESARDDVDAPSAARPETGEDADIRAFVGPNWRFYQPLWAKMKGAPGLRAGRCWSAAAFAGVWLLYRKQYRLGAFILALQVASTYAALEWSPLFDLALAAFLGRYGKSIVLTSGVSRIEKIRAQGLSPEITTIRIAGAGGINSVAPLLGAILLAGALFLAARGQAEGYADAPGDIETLRALTALFPK